MKFGLSAPKAHPPKRNHLLSALSRAEYTRLLPDLEPVPLPLGWSVYEPGVRMGHLFFPTAGIISLLYVTENGSSAEIALTGCEGAVGISLFMGGQSTSSRAVVQSEGQAYKLPSRIVIDEFARGGELQNVLLRFTQALITQMAQTAVCNRHHNVEQQLCRWLLLSLDRLPGDELVMTQELIANMLGVRREGIGVAAADLQKDGLIRYHRGRIKVLDRAKLERRVCECYRAVKQETDRLFVNLARTPSA